MHLSQQPENITVADELRSPELKLNSSKKRSFNHDKGTLYEGQVHIISAHTGDGGIQCDMNDESNKKIALAGSVNMDWHSQNLNQDEIILDEQDSKHEILSQRIRPCNSDEYNRTECANSTNNFSLLVDKQKSEEFEMQQRIDAILSKIESTPSQNCHEEMTTYPIPLSNNQDHENHELEFNNFFSLTHLNNLGKHGKHTERSNKFNEFWHQDYYDPDFNRNPWEELEKVNGLEPTEGWIKYDI